MENAILYKTLFCKNFGKLAPSFIMEIKHNLRWFLLFNLCNYFPFKLSVKFNLFKWLYFQRIDNILL